MKKKEIVLFGGILLVAVIAMIVMKFYPKEEDCGSIMIQVMGENYGTYSLGKDQIIKIHETNVCEIKNGHASMIEANCPDQLCVYQPDITDQGGMIICLPNEVIIEGIPAENAKKDGTAIDSIN